VVRGNPRGKGSPPTFRLSPLLLNNQGVNKKGIRTACPKERKPILTIKLKGEKIEKDKI
jgi:hypothetical protein